MTNHITLREAVTEQDVAFFWEHLHTYHKRDIMPEPENEDLEYFLDETKYRADIEKLHDRKQDRCHYLLFSRDKQDIGFALTVIYDTEDGKCFLMEFCVFPPFRGTGTGTQCAQVFLSWASAQGAAYTELNCNTAQRQNFWRRAGFVPNGTDEWGVPLMLLPPEKDRQVTVEILSDPEDWQLRKLENGYLSEIGEDMLTEESQEALSCAIANRQITFFLAKRGCRAVGMCSTATVFSTFACKNIGIFEDFYVEPAFRKRGIAHRLAEAAQKWCKDNDISSLSVTCAPCDERMYQSLGFDLCLGSTYACISE